MQRGKTNRDRTPAKPARRKAPPPKKKRGSPGTGLLVILIMTVLSVLAVYFVLNELVFVVRRVEVTGAGSFAAEDVIRLAQVPIGKPLRSVDAEKIRRAVESSGQLGFDGVTVRRPDTVVLSVHERALAALVQNAGSVIGVDRDGIILGPYTESDYRDLIFISGLSMQRFTKGSALDVDAETLRAIRETLVALETTGAGPLISELNAADIHQLTLYSRTGIQVNLGEAENLERKLQWTKSALVDLESRGETEGKLDVSSGNKADYKPK